MWEPQQNAGPLIEERAPGHGFSGPEAEERQCRFRQDHHAQPRRRLYDERPEQVGDHVAAQDLVCRYAERAGRFDELTLFQRERFGARQTRVQDPSVDGERHDQVHQARASDQREDRDVQDDRGKRLYQVGDSRDYVVGEPPGVARPGAKQGAKQDRHANHDDPDDCGEARTVEQRAQDIDPVVPGPEEVRP